jgi:hypothetical protein
MHPRISIDVEEISELVYSTIHAPPPTPCALTDHHAIKAYWGSGDKAPRILDLSHK